LSQAQALASGSFAWRVATMENTWSAETYKIFGYEEGPPVNVNMNCGAHASGRSIFVKAIDAAY
jgi:hypothetical protein